MSTLTRHSSRPNRVVGIDPGFERLGIAVIERSRPHERLIASRCARTVPSLSFPDRLHALGEEVRSVFRDHGPDAVALETLFFAKNQKTAMAVAEVRGMLVYLAREHRLPIFEYTPLQVKVAVTGYGKSEKSQVGSMVERLMLLPKKKRLDDELDAIAIALTCLAST